VIGGAPRPVTEPARFTPIADDRPDDVVWPELAWPPAPGIRLRGRFVELTLVVPERDALELFAALDHDAVWRHDHGRPANAAAFAGDLVAALATGRVPWLVRAREPLGPPAAGTAAGEVVGTSSYLDISVPDASLEIGATLYPPAAWASAVNPETKLLLLGHAFEVLHAGRVQLKTDVRNNRSQQASARLGARYEGTLRRHKRRADGTMRDSILFSITAEDWPAVRAGLAARLDGPEPA
jgi:RimJ/RimL family protein N-acetyltransferase